MKNNENRLTISQELIHYILKKSYLFYQIAEAHGSYTHDFADFVLSIISDAATIEATDQQIKQCIDLALDSILTNEP